MCLLRINRKTAKIFYARRGFKSRVATSKRNLYAYAVQIGIKSKTLLFDYFAGVYFGEFVAAPEGHLIKLDFRDWFAIELSTDCKNDFLEVRDGQHGYNTPLERPFCGFDFPPMLTSTDRHLWIHFRSDENIEYKGFKAVFEFIPRPPSCKLCACISS